MMTDTIEPISDARLSAIEAMRASRAAKWTVFTGEVECTGKSSCPRREDDDACYPCHNCEQVSEASIAPEFFEVDCGDYHGLSNDMAEYIADLHNELPAIVARLRKAEAERDAAVMAIKVALPQAEICWVNHYGDNPEGGAVPQHIQMMRDATALKETGHD